MGALSLRSKMGVGSSLFFCGLAGCLWAIPIFAREAFGIHSRWNEHSTYFLTSAALGIIGWSIAAWLIEPEGKRAKWIRRALIGLSVLMVLLTTVTLLLLAMMSIAMGLS